jgi:hypothetical protein
MKELLSRVDRFLPTQQIEVVCPFENWFFGRSIKYKTPLSF